MKKITAKGFYNGDPLTVSAETVADTHIWHFLFDGKVDPEKELDLELSMMRQHPVGGTYYPDEGTGLYVIAGLSWFFDRDPEISAEIDEHIPGEEGVVF